MNKNKILTLVIAALLCALGIMIPMVMPKIVIGPMSFTLASHVPIFIAMFISLPVALIVGAVTTLGFFLAGMPLIVVLRAASQLVFITIGAWMLKNNGKLLKSFGGIALFSGLTAVIHGVCEAIVVTFFYFGGAVAASFYENGFAVTVLLLVGVGTIVHSIIDCAIAMLIWKPVQHIVKIPVNANI